MPLGLRRTIADLVPARLFRGEFVELIAQPGLGIERIRRDRKALLFGQDLAQRGAAQRTEAATIFVGRFRLIARDLLPAPKPAQIVALHKDDGARPHLPAARAVTCPHHRRHGEQLELNRAATAASPDHPVPFPNTTGWNIS
ncbi:hypothetical protein SDC9_12925 [bioreactor metagenome]|uniref:Uncharacterized protein n=1 Tax=bioreactor metagenome TaxID=1076179 RepID=A0A644TK03_9ZZZZ